MSEDIVDALERVEDAVGRVETAVKEKWSTVQWIVLILVGTFLWSLPGRIWHSRWRYKEFYNIDDSKIHVDAVPHDCAFFSAPLGDKYCHYERVVQITRWSSNQYGYPFISYDDGKTWEHFSPPENVKVPAESTVEEVNISWEKKED
jgi:hypothetical protein